MSHLMKNTAGTYWIWFSNVYNKRTNLVFDSAEWTGWEVMIRYQFQKYSEELY